MQEYPVVQEQAPTYPQLPRQGGGEYRQVPAEVEQSYKQLGFLPLRSTVEALGLRVKFNPEQKNSTIYDPNNPNNYFTVPSMVAYGVAFAAQDAVAAAVKHIRSRKAEGSVPAEAQVAPEAVALPQAEAPVFEQPPVMEAVPAPQWPVESAKQRPYMLQALQPEAGVQHGIPGRQPPVDVMRMQALQHMLSKTHRDIGEWWAK